MPACNLTSGLLETLSSTYVGQDAVSLKGEETRDDAPTQYWYAICEIVVLGSANCQLSAGLVAGNQRAVRKPVDLAGVALFMQYDRGYPSRRWWISSGHSRRQSHKPSHPSRAYADILCDGFVARTFCA